MRPRVVNFRQHFRRLTDHEPRPLHREGCLGLWFRARATGMMSGLEVDMALIPTGGRAMEVPGWPDRFMSGALTTFDIPMDEAAAGWWAERFCVGDRILYPEQLALRLTQGLPGRMSCRFTSVLPEQSRVSLELHGADDSSNRLWFLGETLWFEPDRYLFHDLAEVRDNLQGEGLGKTMMCNCFTLAREIGLEEMRLKASWVGSYAWLRFGFTPSKKDWEGQMKARLTEKVLEYKPQLDPSAFNGMLRLLSSDRPRTAWLIADDRTPIAVDGEEERVPLGRALLAETDVVWNGTLSFDDEIAVERFNTYVGR